MAHFMLVAAAGFLGLVPLPEDERVVFPPMPPPQFVLVDQINRANGTVTVLLAESIPVTREVVVNILVDGKKIPETRRITEYKVVAKSFDLRIDGDPTLADALGTPQ